ncbi:LutC/YkgG family protein [Rhodovulum sp. DZ06]|uniref:LutC/YkgG family protein n=1 Tax=Rhodovulum sp. DZ06 TaxID=3425126 RepID=UPI003D32C4DE
MTGTANDTARQRILTRVRRGAEDSAHAAGRSMSDRRAAAEARLAAAGTRRAPTPAAATLEGEARVAQFLQKLEAVDGTWDRIPSLDALPAALSEALRGRNLPAAIRMGADPELTGLDWAGLDASSGVGRIEEPATLSRAAAASAETGTLALVSGPDNPVTLTFLGETHFVALKRSEILGGLDDVWEVLRARGALPRTVNLVTGPSRSADIGQVLQLGAHGPVALHVFVIED